MIVPLKAVAKIKIRPARGEIIVATGVKLRQCGVQLRGWRPDAPPIHLTESRSSVRPEL